MSRTQGAGSCGEERRETPPYAGIVVATDLSDASVAALETAMTLFQPSQITLYHAFDMPYRGLVDDRAAYEADARASALNETRIRIAPRRNIG